MSLITHVDLTRGSTTWKIAASITEAPNTVRSNVVISSIDGILSPGELSENPIPRSYSDGFVFNPQATRAGKDVSIDIVFYADSEATLRSDWNSFQSFIQGSTVLELRTYGLAKTYEAQVQSLEVTSTLSNNVIRCTLFLATREAF